MLAFTAAAAVAQRVAAAGRMQQLAGLQAAVLLNTVTAGKHALLQLGAGLSTSTGAAAAAADGADTADGVRPGQAFLASLIDYEKLGVPKSAGVSSSSSSSKSLAGSSSSSSASFDLCVMRQLLAELGTPQQQLKVVHVAGTKGKGSVVVLLSAMLRAAGLKVGTYTSPHLFDIRERVVVGGGDAASASNAAAAAAAVPVSESQWEDLAVDAQAAVQNMQQQQQGAADNPSDANSSRPSHFEVVTAMALQHFARQRADIAVIETGLGGATDATNVFGPDQLQAAVLTAIGLDHVEALGGSLRSIAAAKAGIMKPGVPVVVGRQGMPDSNNTSPAAAAAAETGQSGGSQPQHEQQQQQQEEGAAGHGSSAAVVWEVLRAAAGQPDMQCPIISAEQVVQVTLTAGNSSISIQNGPAPNLARQSISIQAAMEPLQADTQQQQLQQQQQCASVEGQQQQKQEQLSLSDVQLQLVGSHQTGNVQTAVAAALLLRQRGWDSITEEAIAAGLQQAWLPGRFQVAEMPGSAGCHVVLDAAHTADSAAVLASTLRDAFPDQPVALVLAMAGDKQHREVCQALQACRPSAVVFTTVPIAGSHHRAAPPGTLAAQWQAASMLSSGPHLRCRQLIQANLGAALEKARHELRAHGTKAGVVIVTGSLHAVAAAMKQLGLA